MSSTGSPLFKIVLVLFVTIATVWGTSYVLDRNEKRAFLSSEPIKVGVLHSLSGTMAISENAVAQATLLAIDEINASGGLLGRRVEAIVRDGRSDAAVFALEAEDLITTHGVSVVFGCWTSECRKTVKPIFEKHANLLFYPIQYEGMEQSPNIVYMGAAPNQQIIPALKWAQDQLGSRFFIVGSDYVFPRAAGAIMTDQIRALNGTLLGQHYIPLGSTAVEPIIDAIVRAQPDVILNTLNGASNIAFFTALRERGIRSEQMPTISFSLSETEVPVIGSALLEGDYAIWNYFQSLPGQANADLVARFKQQLGADAVINDPMVSAYIGVMFWAAAVRRAHTVAPQTVRHMLSGTSVAGPQGPVSMDVRTMHVWKPVFMGQIQQDGQFRVVWSLPRPVRPQPFPPSRTPLEWHDFLQNLYSEWGGRWGTPAEDTSEGGEGA